MRQPLLKDTALVYYHGYWAEKTVENIKISSSGIL